MKKAAFLIILFTASLNIFAQIKADDLDGNNTSACIPLADIVRMLFSR